MSRVGKYPIALPADVSVSQQGATLSVKGRLGTLSMPVSDAVSIAIEDGRVVVAPAPEHATGRIMWGTVRSIVASMVQGVSKGYQQNLEINGTGYRAAVQGVNLVLNLGFSHDVVFPVPEGLKITTPRPTLIVIDGMDKRLVGETAANICRFRKIDPYKGKGIKREGQQIRRKEGKKK